MDRLTLLIVFAFGVLLVFVSILILNSWKMRKQVKQTMSEETTEHTSFTSSSEGDDVNKDSADPLDGSEQSLLVHKKDNPRQSEDGVAVAVLTDAEELQALNDPE